MYATRRGVSSRWFAGPLPSRAMSGGGLSWTRQPCSSRIGASSWNTIYIVIVMWCLRVRCGAALSAFGLVRRWRVARLIWCTLQDQPHPGDLPVGDRLPRGSGFRRSTYYVASRSADRLVGLFRGLFVEGKFYSLFSILFGVGIALQSRRAERAGQPFAKVYVRRLIVLILIGIVHGVFFFSADILAFYAVVAIVA